jgi:PAS domain S-box-containing protein
MQASDSLQELALSEERLALAIEAAEVGTWDLDLTTNVLRWDDRTRAMFGFSPGRPCSMDDFYAGLHPEDLQDTSVAFATALDPSVRAIYDVEYRTVGREDGKVRWVAAKGKGLFNEQGTCVRAIGTAIDITARKELEERQRLLTLELKHRMKNTIAMIQAIAAQSLRGGPAVDVARDKFTSRLDTLAKAQDLLTQTAWTKARLRPLLETALRPHGLTERFEMCGPDIELSSKCALAMALAAHELATNAVKYGALRHDDGRVVVTWQVTDDEFRFHWQEIDGPPVVPPSQKGFGSRMIEKALAGYFAGETKIEYRPHGVVFALNAPVGALSTE